MSLSEDVSSGPSGSQTAVNEADPFLRSLIGGAVILLAADFAEPIFFGEGFYSTLSIHPYWIIVILAAAQSGLYVGVAIAGLATLMMDWPTRPIGVDITSHYIDTAILPLQWLIAALAIGVFRQGQLREEARLRQDNARLIRMSDQMSKEVLRLDAALARSELAAVTRPDDSIEHRVGHVIRPLARLAEASRRIQSDRVEALPHPPSALLVERTDGNFGVEHDGIEPWIPEESISNTHPVAAAVKSLDGHAIVRTKDACFVCCSLPQHGARPIQGALVAVLLDETRIDDMKDWLRLLAPLVSVALDPEGDRDAVPNGPAFQTVARLPYLLKNRVY